MQMRVRNGTLSPWPELIGMRREMADLLDNLAWRQGESGGLLLNPAVSVREDEERLTIEVEVPGVSPDDIEISLEDGTLRIAGEKRSGETEENGAYHVAERRYGRFERTFTLPRNFDAENAKASCENGVLQVTLPKKEEARPRRIRIEGSQAGQQIEG